MKVYEADIFRVLPLMDDNNFDLVIADPVYSWNEDKHRFLWNEVKRISSNWRFIYGDLEGLKNDVYPKPDQYVFWKKQLSTKNNINAYYNHVEVIYIWGEGKFPGDRHWSQIGNVWEDDVMWEERVDIKGKHEWRKSVAQMMRIIRNHTKAGDRILDICAGSAPMRDACKLYDDRSYTGLEIDPKWCDEKWKS